MDSHAYWFYAAARHFSKWKLRFFITHISCCFSEGCRDLINWRRWLSYSIKQLWTTDKESSVLAACCNHIKNLYLWFKFFGWFIRGKKSYLHYSTSPSHFLFKHLVCACYQNHQMLNYSQVSDVKIARLAKVTTTNFDPTFEIIGVFAVKKIKVNKK